MKPGPGLERAAEAAQRVLLQPINANQLAQPIEELPLPVELFGDIKPVLSNRHIVKGLLLAGTKIVIFGQEGSAKSFLLLDILLHVAADLAWFGRRVCAGGVVYIVAEGQAGARLRVEAWKRDKGIFAGLPFAIIPTVVDLLDPGADLAKLHQVIDCLTTLWGAPPVVIAIDTLSQTIGGGDENGPDMMGYVTNCGRLAAPYDCATIIVHHQPLDAASKRPRGHSSLAGSVDTMIHVAGRDNPRRVSIIKQKDLEREGDFLFELKPVEIGQDEEGQPVTSCVVRMIEGEAPKVEGRKLSATNKTALAALDRAIVRSGFPPPTTIPSGLIPPLTGKVTNLFAWQDEALAAFADADKSADTAARTFRRARQELQAAEIIGVYGDYVWHNFTSRTGGGQ